MSHELVFELLIEAIAVVPEKTYRALPWYDDTLFSTKFWLARVYFPLKDAKLFLGIAQHPVEETKFSVTLVLATAGRYYSTKYVHPIETFKVGGGITVQSICINDWSSFPADEFFENTLRAIMRVSPRVEQLEESCHQRK